MTLPWYSCGIVQSDINPAKHTRSGEWAASARSMARENAAVSGKALRSTTMAGTWAAWARARPPAPGRELTTSTTSAWMRPERQQSRMFCSVVPPPDSRTARRRRGWDGSGASCDMGASFQLGETDATPILHPGETGWPAARQGAPPHTGKIDMVYPP